MSMSTVGGYEEPKEVVNGVVGVDSGRRDCLKAIGILIVSLVTNACSTPGLEIDFPEAPGAELDTFSYKGVNVKLFVSDSVDSANIDRTLIEDKIRNSLDIVIDQGFVYVPTTGATVNIIISGSEEFENKRAGMDYDYNKNGVLGPFLILLNVDEVSEDNIVHELYHLITNQQGLVVNSHGVEEGLAELVEDYAVMSLALARQPMDVKLERMVEAFPDLESMPLADPFFYRTSVYGSRVGAKMKSIIRRRMWEKFIDGRDMATVIKGLTIERHAARISEPKNEWSVEEFSEMGGRMIDGFSEWIASELVLQQTGEMRVMKAALDKDANVLSILHLEHKQQFEDYEIFGFDPVEISGIRLKLRDQDGVSDWETVEGPLLLPEDEGDAGFLELTNLVPDGFVLEIVEINGESVELGVL